MGVEVTLYTTRFCPYCIRARSLLDARAVSYREIAVDRDPDLRLEMITRSGRRTVPQIWVGERHIGGYDDLRMLDNQGRLDEILERVRLGACR